MRAHINRISRGQGAERGGRQAGRRRTNGGESKCRRYSSKQQQQQQPRPAKNVSKGKHEAAATSRKRGRNYFSHGGSCMARPLSNRKRLTLPRLAGRPAAKNPDCTRKLSCLSGKTKIANDPRVELGVLRERKPPSRNENKRRQHRQHQQQRGQRDHETRLTLAGVALLEPPTMHHLDGPVPLRADGRLVLQPGRRLESTAQEDTRGGMQSCRAAS